MALKKSLKLTFKPVGLGAQVAEILTQAILEGRFKGGDQLVENDLQTHFGVSRSPLREALRELEKKGLVVLVPRKGAFVVRITRKEVEENFPVRAALEGLASKLALANMTDEALKRMGRALEKMRTAVKTRDTKLFYTHHLEFHETFIERSGNEALIALLKNLRMQSIWHRFSYQYYQEDLEKSFKVHLQIQTLFLKKNTSAEKLGALVENHINVARDRFLAYVEEFERR
ncbi:MAG TPA: GntR family transcriptional regulator [Desulfobacterales bacterium]|nr:GntR family transcriptional regulator [Desulfobacterales bacterium]